MRTVKQLITLFIASVMLLSLTACLPYNSDRSSSDSKKRTLDIDITVPTSIALIKKNESFHANGIIVNVPEDKGFHKIDFDNFDLAFESDDMLFGAQKEPFDTIEGAEDFTAEDYAALLRDSRMSDSDISMTQPRTKGNLVYMEFQVEDVFGIVAVYKASDAFWNAQFYCEGSDYSENRSDFIDWLENIIVI